MTSWAPDRTDTVRVSAPHPGQGDTSALYLWVVPAEARGRWLGAGSELTIHQNYQQVEVEGRIAGRTLQAPRATLQGRDLVLEDPVARFRGRVEDSRITGELILAERRVPVILKQAR